MTGLEPQSLGSRRITRALPILLVAVVPAVLLSGGVVRFILNHFFGGAPYLWDSGLLSGLSYRAGVLLHPAEVTGPYADSFYQVYVSPIMSVLSGLSYLVPVRRIEWFAIVQGLVYFPIAIAVHTVSSQLEAPNQLRRVGFTMLAAIAFAFSGLVLWTVGFPHYEIATSGLVCLVVAAAATGRRRLAWTCLVLAASVRQDGGLHTALALAPLLFLSWRGVEMALTTRQLVAMIVAAIVASVAAFIFQRIFFVPLDRLRAVYLGTPPYAHLTASLIAARLGQFRATCQVVYYPFLATVVIAAFRRDGRYLLGWLAALPWFLFNFAAYDEQKAHFSAYTVGPFIVSMFWMLIYGAALAPKPRRMRARNVELLFALVCMSSTLGFQCGAPQAFKETLRQMAYSKKRDRAAVYGFVDALREHRSAFGRLYVDGAIAALALESLKAGEAVPPGQSADTIAFHDRAVDEKSQTAADLAANQLDVCTHILQTGIFVCSHERLPPGTWNALEIEVAPSVFAYTNLHGRGLSVDERGVVVQPGANVGGWLGRLPSGKHTLTMDIVAADASGDGGGLPMATLEITEGEAVIASTSIATNVDQVSLEFITRGSADVRLTFTSHMSSVVIHAARVRETLSW